MNRCHIGRRAVAAAAVVAGFCAPVAALAQTSTPPSLPSAIGNETPIQIVVSPAFARTQVILTVASSSACNCVHLWLSRDGGITWTHQAATGWSPGRLADAVDGSGHDVLFTAGSAGLQRSGDLGANWTTVGPSGMATPSQGYATDATVAVAGTRDYLLNHSSATAVSGSGGHFADYEFMLAPGFPDGGPYAPALLSAYDGHAKTAQVLRCSTSLSCSLPVPLPGPPLTGAPLLMPSTAYASDGTVFALMAANIYKSTDGGATFSPITVGQTADVTGTNDLALDPGYREHGGDRGAYAAIVQWNTKVRGNTFGGVYRTVDGGATWTRFGAGGPLDQGAGTVAVTPDGRVLAGYQQPLGGGLVCWTGSSWAATCPAAVAAGAGHAAQCTSTSCTHSAAPVAAGGPGGASGSDVAPAAAATQAPGGDAAATLDAAGAGGTPSHTPQVAVAVVVMLLLGAAATGRALMQRRSRRAG